MSDTNEIRKLSSSESIRISLEAVRLGEAGLNQHRQSLLNRVPNQKDSLIVSYITGDEKQFTKSAFDDIY